MDEQALLREVIQGCADCRLAVFSRVAVTEQQLKAVQEVLERINHHLDEAIPKEFQSIRSEMAGLRGDVNGRLRSIEVWRAGLTGGMIVLAAVAGGGLASGLRALIGG